MKIMNMVNAINDALDIKLKEDDSVIVYGEDVGVEGGVFRITEGLQKKYGNLVAVNEIHRVLCGNARAGVIRHHTHPIAHLER